MSVTSKRWVSPALLLLSFLVVTAVLSQGLKFAPEPVGSRADMFWEGAQTTLWLTLVASAIGLVIGVVAGLAGMSVWWVFKIPAMSLISVVRGTPLLVQILFIYYAVPVLFPWLRLTEFWAGAVALSLNVGAYNAEVVRAGIQAIPKGQKEAASSLGLSGLQTLIFIVLPQALRVVIPPLVNNVVALLKDSSLVSSIGLLELSLTGNRVSSETFQPVPVLTTIAVIYWMLTSLISWLARLVENRWRLAV